MASAAVLGRRPPQVSRCNGLETDRSAYSSQVARDLWRQLMRRTPLNCIPARPIATKEPSAEDPSLGTERRRCLSVSAIPPLRLTSLDRSILNTRRSDGLVPRPSPVALMARIERVRNTVMIILIYHDPWRRRAMDPPSSQSELLSGSTCICRRPASLQNKLYCRAQ